MDNTQSRTALVTGTTSGLGHEAAGQFAEQGYGRVIVTGRNTQKLSTSIDRLVARTGKNVFEPLVVDNDDLASVEAASTELAARGGQIDVAVLNAGIAPPKDVVMTSSGLEATVTSSLIGHHLLTMRLLELDLLADHARIVIAGSEAARGDVPTFNPVDIRALADQHFNGDLEAAVEAQMRVEPPATYKAGDTYASAKVFVAWWAAELARILPAGMTVNAVSPGSTPDTNAIDNAPFYMRKLMVPLFKLMPGMSHSVADGAARYLEVVGYGPEVTGKFFASKPKKMTGPLTEMTYDHIDDREGQQALWNVTTRVVGGVGYKAA